MVRRFWSYLAILAIVSMGLGLLACNGKNSTSPTMPDVASVDASSAHSADGNGSVKTMSDDDGWQQGCNGLGAKPLNFSDGDYFVPGDTILVKYRTAYVNGPGDAHLAVFDHTKPVGDQDIIDQSFIPGGYTYETLSFTLAVHVPMECGRQFQLDAGCGKRAPRGAAYDADTLAGAWHFGTYPCDKVIPTPEPTPTPHCNNPTLTSNGFTSSTCDPIPTPTLPPHCEDGHGQDDGHGNCVPDPTPTPHDHCEDGHGQDDGHGNCVPDPTPTPRPTSTPNPTATPTPQPTATPNGWDKSSLSFNEGCNVSGNTITVTICNVGSGNMAGSSAFEVYYKASGNPMTGAYQGNGVISAMNSGNCQSLSFTTSGLDGNYKFRALQRPGHPGQGDLWSDTCTID